MKQFTELTKQSGGIPIAMQDGKLIGLDSTEPRKVLCCGPSGCGKSYNFMLPNLLEAIERGEPIVVTDPLGSRRTRIRSREGARIRNRPCGCAERKHGALGFAAASSMQGVFCRRFLRVGNHRLQDDDAHSPPFRRRHLLRVGICDVFGNHPVCDREV